MFGARRFVGMSNYAGADVRCLRQQLTISMIKRLIISSLPEPAAPCCTGRMCLYQRVWLCWCFGCVFVGETFSDVCVCVCLWCVRPLGASVECDTSATLPLHSFVHSFIYSCVGLVLEKRDWCVWCMASITLQLYTQELLFVTYWGPLVYLV